MPITHEWNGTILTITSDSGSSSCDLKGEKGDDGARGPQGVAGDCIATDTAKLDGKDAKYYIQPYNLSDNSNFEIAQAGYCGYHGNKLFVACRWEGAFTTSTFTRTADGINHYASNEDSYSFIFQKLFGDGREKGKTYTFAITLANGDIRTATGTFPTSDVSTQTTIATVIVKENCRLYILKDADGYIRLRIDLTQPNAYVDFLNVAFYEGSYTAENLPPYISKGYAVELAECQRYYLPIEYAPSSAGYVDNTDLIMYVNVPVPVKMRILPSITYNNAYGTLAIYTTNGKLYKDIAGITTTVNSSNFVQIKIRFNDALSYANKPCFVEAYDRLINMALSADL